MPNTNTAQEPNLILLDSWGIYIPQMFCSDIDEQWAEQANVQMQDVRICQQGPDHELYWDAWNNILDNTEVTRDGVTWRLHQDGDLWEVPDGYEWPDN